MCDQLPAMWLYKALWACYVLVTFALPTTADPPVIPLKCPPTSSTTYCKISTGSQMKYTCCLPTYFNLEQQKCCFDTSALSSKQQHRNNKCNGQNKEFAIHTSKVSTCQSTNPPEGKPNEHEVTHRKQESRETEAPGSNSETTTSQGGTGKDGSNKSQAPGNNSETTTSQGKVASTGKQGSNKSQAPGNNSGLFIGLIAGLVGAIVIAVIAILVTFRVCRRKREVTEDAEKTTAAGIASREAGAKPNMSSDKDDGYMDIQTLDKPEAKPQVNELDDVSMDGPYSTVKGPAMNAGQVQKDVKPADVVMVENEDYEGIVEGKTSGQPGEVVMVENEDYEEFVAGNGNDGVEMVENEDYERVPPGDGRSDGVAMVENENYEGIPSG